MDIITGNRFLEMSDMAFLDGEIKLRKTAKQGKLIVFCETHHLKEFFNLAKSKPGGELKYILVTHNSDGCIRTDPGREYDYQFVEKNIPESVISWYAQNMDVLSDRIRPLPIGLENFAWHKGKKWTELAAVRTQCIAKTKDIYLNVEPTTNLTERETCIGMLKKRTYVTYSPRVSYLQYISEMAQHRFVACPEGNGFDTHRTWEALYLGCIPIVRRRIFTEMLSRLYPMVLIRSWDDVTQSLLHKYDGRNVNQNNMSFASWEQVVRGRVKVW